MNKKTILILTVFALTSVTYTKPEIIKSSIYFLITKPINVFKTWRYISNLNVKTISERGAGFANFKISEWNPEDLAVVDSVYDYDYVALELLTKKMENVDRLKVLQEIFNQLTKHHKNSQQKFESVVTFLQKASFHNPFRQPTFANKQPVLDPLLILETNEMRCSQVSGLGVDIFRAGGWPARLVQLGGHIVGEAYYNNSWHYYDADFFSNGVIFKNKSGKIPSVIELSQNPEWIDSLPPSFEYISTQSLITSHKTASYFFFSTKSYESTKPMYYEKTNKASEDKGLYYGWDYYTSVIDHKRKMYTLPIKYQPGTPLWKSVSVTKESQSIELTWNTVSDFDNDVIGYYIFVSKKPRGWNFLIKNPSDLNLNKYWHDYGEWKPTQYDYLRKRPPSEILKTFTKNTELTVQIKEPGQYYISLMAEDAYGKKLVEHLTIYLQN